MTTFNDMVYVAGGLPVMAGLPFSRDAKYYYVDPATGSDSFDGLTPGTALATIAAAEDKCVANRHDTVFYIAGSSSVTLSAALTWDKNYTHLIGIAAPTQVGQRARIFQLSSLTGASPLLNITASGCIFKNFYLFQGVDDNTSLINVQVTGGRNYFENVHFAGGGHATQAINGGASLELDGAEENTFVNCTIGVDTIDAATGMVGLLVDTEAKRNKFIDCTFTMSAGHTGAAFVELVDGTAIDRYLEFRRCSFINSNFKNFLMASAFVIPAIAANRNCSILLQDCMFHGVSKLDAGDRGFLYGNMDVVTPVDLSGVAKELRE